MKTILSKYDDKLGRFLHPPRAPPPCSRTVPGTLARTLPAHGRGGTALVQSDN